MENVDLVSPEEAHYTVYKLTSPENKVYIGCTGQRVKKRWCAGLGYDKSTPIRKAIAFYGWENIKKEILCEKLTKEGAEQLEKWFIEYYDSMNPEKGYNRITGGSRKGARMSEISKRISSESKNRLYKERPEVIEKIRNRVKAAYENDPDYRNRVGRGVQKAYENDPTYKERRSRAMCSLYENDPAYRERVRKGICAAYENDPTLRTRLADIAKRHWEDPDYRSRVVESLEAYYDGNPEAASMLRERNRQYYLNHPERRREIAEQMSRYLLSPEGRKFAVYSSRPKAVRCVETGEVYSSAYAAERVTGFASIHKACRGQVRVCGGYHWEYVNPEDRAEV